MRIPSALFALALLAANNASSQSALESVIVEKYYISDANDATDTDGGYLEEGSVTYRVFLDMGADCKLRGLFGDTLHPFIISSTTVLFNNEDRGEFYGFEIGDNYVDDGTVALDSWLTLGAASDAHIGVVKTDDPDTSIVAGEHNDGGSESVPGGLLVNGDPDAGIPLTDKDGLVAGTAAPPNWLFIGDPLLSLRDENLDTTYTSPNMILQEPAGVPGYGPDNKILIAQITTTGDLEFHLNVEIIDGNGTPQKFVANGDTLLAGQTEFGLLNYPPECGCMDPNYLEYDPAAGCDDGSCATAIVFGCLDSAACNFDPGANFNVLALCCYGPGNCNGLDISIVCPDVSVGDDAIEQAFSVFPNPVHDHLSVRLATTTNERAALLLHDREGRLVLEAALQASAGARDVLLDLSALANGLYTLRLVTDGHVFVQGLVKQ